MFRLSRLRGALHICSTTMRETFSSHATKLTDGKTFIERVNDIAVNRTDMFRSCVWDGLPTDCGQFKYVMTEHGPCFVFNVLNSNRIYTNM